MKSFSLFNKRMYSVLDMKMDGAAELTINDAMDNEEVANVLSQYAALLRQGVKPLEDNDFREGGYPVRFHNETEGFEITYVGPTEDYRCNSVFRIGIKKGATPLAENCDGEFDPETQLWGD